MRQVRLRNQAFFELGELQYSAGHYADAAKSYLTVMNSDDATDYVDDAAYGYLLAEIKSVNFPLEDAGAVKPQRAADGTAGSSKSAYDSRKNFYEGGAGLHR